MQCSRYAVEFYEQSRIYDVPLKPTKPLAFWLLVCAWFMLPRIFPRNLINFLMFSNSCIKCCSRQTRTRDSLYRSFPPYNGSVRPRAIVSLDLRRVDTPVRASHHAFRILSGCRSSTEYSHRIRNQFWFSLFCVLM